MKIEINGDAVNGAAFTIYNSTMARLLIDLKEQWDVYDYHSFHDAHTKNIVMEFEWVNDDRFVTTTLTVTAETPEEDNFLRGARYVSSEKDQQQVLFITNFPSAISCVGVVNDRAEAA